MGKRVDVRGKKFGTLRALNFDFSKNGSYWICLCDCGNKRSIRLDQLTKTKNPSCGCQKQKNIKECQIKHGFRNSGDERKSEYTAWVNMKGRCLNKNDKGYKSYGGRGIKVCKRWLSFENFINDVGNKPDGMTLDRINSNGNYEPSNCRWASWKVQQNNRRDNLGLDFVGESKRIGITRGALMQRWRRGKAVVPKLNMEQLLNGRR